MITCNFNNTITERDMDLLLAEAISTDLDFCRMILDKTDLKGRPFTTSRVEVSKSDSDFGETDILVIVNIDGEKHGLLIEDKIDAIAMPDQHGRYIKRGDIGVRAGEYVDYRVFIFCPKKYYQGNSEAKKYEYLLTYEECKEFFDSKDDLLSSFRSQHLEQAITKAKKPSIINVDERANAFLRQYIQYQRENYPSLDLSTKEDRNGWWTDYRTELGAVYINHKLREGFVDLTFPRAADSIDKAKTIVEWARQHKIPATVVKTKKSAMIRIHVPKLDIMKGFDSVDRDELNECFDMIKELTDFANMIEIASSLADI